MCDDLDGAFQVGRISDSTCRQPCVQWQWRPVDQDLGRELGDVCENIDRAFRLDLCDAAGRRADLQWQWGQDDQDLGRGNGGVCDDLDGAY